MFYDYTRGDPSIRNLNAMWFFSKPFFCMEELKSIDVCLNTLEINELRLVSFWKKCLQI